jgi:hypothetical protein
MHPTYFMEILRLNIPIINRIGFACSAAHGYQKFAMIIIRDIAVRVAEHLVRRDFEGKKVRDIWASAIALLTKR